MLQCLMKGVDSCLDDRMHHKTPVHLHLPKTTESNFRAIRYCDATINTTLLKFRVLDSFSGSCGFPKVMYTKNL